MVELNAEAMWIIQKRGEVCEVFAFEIFWLDSSTSCHHRLVSYPLHNKREKSVWRWFHGWSYSYFIYFVSWYYQVILKWWCVWFELSYLCMLNSSVIICSGDLYWHLMSLRLFSMIVLRSCASNSFANRKTLSCDNKYPFEGLYMSMDSTGMYCCMMSFQLIESNV